MESFMWRMPSWESGEELVLGQLKPDVASLFSNSTDSRYSVLPNFTSRIQIQNSEWKTRMEMLSLYSQLTPPKYQKQPNEKGPKTFRSIRLDGRSLDLAWWLGRPCIIVMGFIPEAPIPVKVDIDGNGVQDSDGVTFVRWVYPLKQ